VSLLFPLYSSPVKQIILVGLGGALGAVARWKLGGIVLHHSGDWRFPLSTFVVNVLGCVIAGVLAGLVTKLDLFAADTRLFMFTGLLGGFTTFSAFGLETVYLLRRTEYAVAAGYVVLSVAGGVAGLWLAMRVVPGEIPK
jgi:CrcB protein